MRETIKEQADQDFEMEMTPMIDVVFLLIIFFLCIDFKVLEAKLPAYLPKDVGSHSTSVEPQEKLRIGINCENWGTEQWRNPATKLAYRLVGHEISWDLGPRRIHELSKLRRELERVYKDPTKRQKDPKTGEMKPMGIVIEPGPQTTYQDVARTVDAVLDVGFKEINFGGGLGARKKGPKK